mgnify:CR=1 FL=1
MYMDNASIGRSPSFADKISGKIRETRLMHIVDRMQWVLIIAAFLFLWLSIMFEKKEKMDDRD